MFKIHRDPQIRWTLDLKHRPPPVVGRHNKCLQGRRDDRLESSRDNVLDNRRDDRGPATCWTVVMTVQKVATATF